MIVCPKLAGCMADIMVDQTPIDRSHTWSPLSHQLWFLKTDKGGNQGNLYPLGVYRSQWTCWSSGDSGHEKKDLTTILLQGFWMLCVVFLKHPIQMTYSLVDKLFFYVKWGNSHIKLGLPFSPISQCVCSWETNILRMFQAPRSCNYITLCRCLSHPKRCCWAL